MKYEKEFNNESTSPNIFSIINKKNLVIRILNALPDDLKPIVFQLSEFDKNIAIMAIKSGDLGLINYMTNWNYENSLPILKDIKTINPNYLHYADSRQLCQEFQTEKENYIDNEAIYLKYFSRLFDLRCKSINEFKVYVEKLFEHENNLKIKESDKEFYKKIALSLKLQKDLKFLYKLKIKRINNITEITEIDKRYEEAKNHIEECMKKNNTEQTFAYSSPPCPEKGIEKG